MGRTVRRALLIAFAMALALAIALVVDIWRYAGERSDGSAGAALVLGAAVDGSQPTPVLAERLRHAASLHASGAVRRIVVTGGRSPEDQLSEAAASRDWLVQHGVPAADILIEDQSRTTIQNIDFALPLLRTNGIDTVLIVSDPLHMRRAMMIADRRQLRARPSPTPTTRYQSLPTQLPFVLREAWFTAQFIVTGT